MKLLMFCLLLLMPGIAFAQVPTPNLNAPEYGKLEEIKDKRKAYVMSLDGKAREIIVKELTKNKRFEVVESPELAEFGVLFDVSEQRAGWNTFGFIGQFVVFVKPLEDPNPEKPRVRVLWTTQKVKAYSSGLSFNRHPATNASREFVKQMKKLVKK